MSDQATLTTQRILDCPLRRHQLADTLGGHLTLIETTLGNILTSSTVNNDEAVKIEGLVQDLTNLVKENTEATDAANILNALSSLSSQVGAVAAKQVSDGVKIDYLFQVLRAVAETTVPTP